MDTIIEITEELVTTDRQTCRQAYDGITAEPKPEWVRGECPQCGQPVVSNCYYVGGRGYLITHECWASLGEKPTCTYRKVL